MNNAGCAGPDERERLEHFLEWRRAEGRRRKVPGWHWRTDVALPYVAAIAWLGVAVFTGAVITTLAAGERDGRGRGAWASRPVPVTPPVVPALSVPDHVPGAEPAPATRILPVAHSERARMLAAGQGRGRLESSARAPARKRGPVTTAVGTLGRWVGHVSDANTGRALVRRVRSQPHAAAAQPPEPERPQTR